MILFAEMTTDPRAIISWLGVGLVVGWLAGKVMNSPSYGILGDLLVGSIGAVAGGFLFVTLMPGVAEFYTSIVVAFVLAGLCIGVARFVTRETSAD